MEENAMMTVNEVADYLEVAQADVEHFVESGELPAFRLGGTLLRFKREHVYSFRRKLYSEKMVKDEFGSKPGTVPDEVPPLVTLATEDKDEIMGEQL